MNPTYSMLYTDCDFPSTGSDTIYSFKLEHYENNYVRGEPTQVSLQSQDIPQTTPGYVTNHLSNYAYIDPNEALDNPDR